MHISNKSAEQVVRLSHDSYNDVDQIKHLNQEERRFILEAFKVQLQYAAMIQKLKEKSKLQPVFKKDSFITSIFNGMVNLFGGISSARVYKVINPQNE